MKIAVFSDSHKDFNMLKNAVDMCFDCKVFIHLGDGQFEFQDIARLHPDKQFIFVKGNCDYDGSKTERIIEIGNYKIYCCHGHTRNVNEGLELLLDVAKYNKCNIALYGHTHLYKTELIDGIYVMNPGSISSPRGKNPPTFGIIDITKDGEINMEIIELKKEEASGVAEINEN